MRRRKSIAVSIALLLGVILFISMMPMSAHPVVAPYNLKTLATSSPFPSAVVNITTTAAAKYSLFNLNAPETVEVDLFLSGINSSSPQTVQIISSFKAADFQILAQSTNGSISSLAFVPLSGTYGSFVGYYFTVPPGTVQINGRIDGSQTGESALYRYVSNSPTITINGLGLVPVYNFRLIVPQGTVVSEAFGYGSASVAGSPEPVPPTTTVGAPSGEEIVIVPTNVATLVLQSRYFVPTGIGLVAFAALSLILLALGTFGWGKKRLERVEQFLRIPKVIGALKNVIRGAMAKMHISGRNKPPVPWSKRFESKNLLVLFIICGVLMASIAAMTGPDPSIGVYVIGTSTEAKSVQSSLQTALGSSVHIVTPSEDYSDFNVMASIGEFRVVVVTGYPSLAMQEVGKFVLPQLSNVPIIIIDNSSDPSFSAQVESLYPQNVVRVGSSEQLTSAEMSQINSLVAQEITPNVLGVQISNSNYKFIFVAEGGLSFLLVLLGWAYLGAKVSEPNTDSSLVRLASVVASGIFIFYFSEVIYVVTSATLQYPLSLHAVISGADITATGIFGRTLHIPLGGGSTPRLAAGVVGILFGALSVSWERLYSKRAMGLLLSLALIMIANPFTLGTIAFQGFLLFFGNTPLGVAYASALTLKGFLYGVGSGLGGTVTPTYLMSAGKIVYFAGLIPLAFVRKMGKTTATLTLLISGFFIGDGGVRVGEMTPDKTVIGVVPGLIAGVVIALILLLIAALEKYLTRSYVKARP